MSKPRFWVTLSGTLHDIPDGRTFEQDNIDQAQVFEVSEETVKEFLAGSSWKLYALGKVTKTRTGERRQVIQIRRACKRCFRTARN